MHPHAERDEPSPHRDASFDVSRVLTRLAIGGAVVGAGIILAPYVLPAIGIGSKDMAEEALFVLHTSAESGGSGLAGFINRGLAEVPLIGGRLAAGGLFNTAATALVGIGGVLLGNFVEKREDGSAHIRWGRAIKYAALATSAIIAMPTVLSALSTGLIFLSLLPENVHLANAVIRSVDKTLGTVGMHDAAIAGFSGAAAAIPHFLTCGVSLLPAALSLSLAHKEAVPAADGDDVRHKYTDGSIVAEMRVERPLVAGQEARARLRLSHRKSGLPVRADELSVVHTQKLHLFVTDGSLKDYHHIHPQPTDKPGEYMFSFTPGAAGDYAAWADFTLLRDGGNHKLKTVMKALVPRRISPNIRMSSHAEQAGMQFTFRPLEPLRCGKPGIVEVTVTDAAGNAVGDLEPVMGAFAHLVGFSADGKSIIHTHPMGREPESPLERGEGKLRFHVEPDCAGTTQFYLQVRRGGEDVYVAFGQEIKPPELAAQWQRAAKRSSHGGHAAMPL